jgi:hypothetical protein
VEYGNFLIEIYEHVNNHRTTTTASEKKYFYAPLVLLDHTSAISIYNNVTKQPEMRFRIEMWNDKVQNIVVEHLKKIVSQEIQPDNVRVIPLERVILISDIPMEDYFPSPVWKNYDKSKTLWLSMSCYDQKICDELANEMRSVPKQFDHFKLLYSLSSQTSQTKQATISIDSVTSGQTVSTLLQKFGDKKEIFLTAKDEKKMLKEMTTKIRMDTFDDFEVGSPDAEITIYSFLKDLLVMSMTTTSEQSDKMWDSVFWNDDNYRPDRTTKTLNEILNKMDKETQKKLANMFQKAEKQSIIKNFIKEKIREEDQEILFRHNQQKWILAKNHSDEKNRNVSYKERINHNYDSNSWADVDRISSVISGEMANNSNSSNQFEILKEDVRKLLQESRNHVQWDEEKFIPKPVQLSRINLEKFRDSQSFMNRHVRVRYTTAELSASFKMMEHAGLIIANEWNNLKEEFKGLQQLKRKKKYLINS